MNISKFENDLIMFLKNMNDEYNYQKQFKQRRRYIFEYLYRNLITKDCISKQLKYFDLIEKKLNEISKELHR